MLSPYSFVSAVPKIGPKYKKFLEKLNIYTVEDLLWHFPFRYEDFSCVKSLKNCLNGETVTVKGTLGEVTNIFTKFGKRLTKAKFSDATGELELIWFNQHYLKRTLTPGKGYTVWGTLGTFDSRLAFISPSIEETQVQSIHSGRIVPIYSEIQGITSKWLRSRINDILNTREFATTLVDYLPLELRSQEHLKDVRWALEQIHFPDSFANSDLAKRRFEFEELFMELLNVEHRKQEWRTQLHGYAFKPFDLQIREFNKELPFALTESQNTALQHILADLHSNIPMNRLLEGDVGSGKTVVAIIAAYLAKLNGYKTLYMAPTEILAQQHFDTFTKLLGPTDAKITLKTGSVKEDTDYDILIGTHAILYSQEKYQKVGLVVIDEQHRFGVEQRGKILELGKENYVPNLLTMTATPIPRTLALTLYGDLDISTLDEIPTKTRKVVTKVIPDSKRADAYSWIAAQNNPTFIVCPLIDESEAESLENVKAAEVEFVNLTKTVFKNKKVGLLHGRLKTKEKTDIVSKFKTGEIEILVSTPVIEVGIDIPEATIIAIESGERYGLASLHQLRGRVGRSGDVGHCLVFISNYSHKSYARLKHLETTTSGIKLAEIDMKLRGQGDIFSTLQHGFRTFKIADLNNLELLEKAKQAAVEIYKKLNDYPMLKDRVTTSKGKFVKNN